jgi:hypothetical protein
MSKQSSSGCLAIVASLFGGSEKRNSSRKTRNNWRDTPYRVRDSFLTPAELSFYQVLRTIVGDRATILSKVGLWDIFFVAQPHKHSGAKGHIDRKHVDFLLCDPATMQPIVGLELDDSSHDNAKRRLRDAEVDLVFETAELPLLHIPARRGYNTSELATDLAAFLGKGATVPAAAPHPETSTNAPAGANGTPLCPKCGTPMVVRVASRGEHKGQQFYACPNYPNCKSLLPIT